MGDLYLNALPLSVAVDATTTVGRFWARDNDVDSRLRGNPALGVEFDFRSQNRDTFAWALPGGALPAYAARRGEEASVESLPLLAEGKSVHYVAAV